MSKFQKYPICFKNIYCKDSGVGIFVNSVTFWQMPQSLQLFYVFIIIKKTWVFWEFLQDLMKNPNEWGTLKKIESSMPYIESFWTLK